MPGEFAGSLSSISRRASVPPVEAPTQITISVVRAIALPDGGGSTASAVNLAWVPSVLDARGWARTLLTRACAALLTTSQIRKADSAK
ncbi:hypothetical protein QE369_001421 [Agrobacterium larrymoorei]|uniref:Uncharacterized protein n=1 Tax=Agrobacterium larrymoorei TaxID=160699 RepID=A0AAJ2ES91_9HYPH|nr:hypothetical protein [Agrobacterium larrymoorei]